MKGTITIMKKELRRFFTDYKVVLNSILLPGLLIYCMYTFMGMALNSYKDNTPIVYICGYSERLEALLSETNITRININELNHARKDLKNEKIDLLVIFPENIDSVLEVKSDYAGSALSDIPDIRVFYNSSSTASERVYSSFVQGLKEYELSLVNLYTINNTNDEANVFDGSGSDYNILASLMPMLLIVFLFMGSVPLTTESIAGEKERGTLATILVTTVNRQAVATGKVFALSVIATLSALSSSTGAMLSLPNVFPQDISISYTYLEYFYLGLVLISTVIFLISIISIISITAKTVKEASSYSMPIMFICMGIGIATMFSKKYNLPFVMYVIPVYNSAHSMFEIFSGNVNNVHTCITVVSNCIIAVFDIFILSKLLNKERVIF